MSRMLGWICGLENTGTDAIDDPVKREDFLEPYIEQEPDYELYPNNGNFPTATVLPDGTPVRRLPWERSF